MAKVHGFGVVMCNTDDSAEQETERIRQMVKRYRKTRSRDFFKAAEAKEIETGINEIIDGVKGVAADLGKQLRRMMDVV